MWVVSWRQGGGDPARDRADGGMLTCSDVKAAAKRHNGWLLGMVGRPRMLHSCKRLAIRAGLCAISRCRGLAVVNSIATVDVSMVDCLHSVLGCAVFLFARANTAMKTTSLVLGQ